MASRPCTLALCAIATLLSQATEASPRVIIVETRDAPSLPGLASQVRMHAPSEVSVETVQDRESSSMTFASRASAIVAEQDANVVVWVAAVDEPPGQRTLLVFASGRFPGRALLELVRLDANTPPAEVERTVGLKIASLFKTMTTARPISAALGVTATSIASWRVEIAGGSVIEAGDRVVDARIGAALDHRWSASNWIIAAGAGVHWQPSSAISSMLGIVSIDEVAPSAALALERPLGSVTLFARTRVLASLLFAAGTSINGPHGSAVVLSPVLGAEIGARWALSDMIELVVGTSGEWALTRQQFLVDGEVAADVRNARGSLWFGLSLPIH